MLCPCLVPFLSKGKIGFAHKMRHKVGNPTLCLQYKSPWKNTPKSLKILGNGLYGARLLKKEV